MKTVLHFTILVLVQSILLAQQLIIDEVGTIGIQSTSQNTAAVYGISTYGSAILGSSTHQSGVRGTSINADGTIGQTYSTDINQSGVKGFASAARGVTGQSESGIGVYGTSMSNSGVFGTSTGGYGVYGKSTNEIGVLGESTNSFGVWGNGKTYDFYAWKQDGSIAYGESSSRRWKTNIINIPDPLEKIGKLRGVYFDWKPEYGGLHDVGFIAEEIGAVIPEIVGYEENGIDATGMDYSKMTPLLVEVANAMRQEYQKKFDEQKQLINLLMDANESIHKEMANLKQLMNMPIVKTNLSEKSEVF